LSARTQSEISLTSDEARRRPAQFGPNDPAPVKHSAAIFQIASFFANPLVLILVIAAAAATNPPRSRPSAALATTTVFVVLAGAAIPYTALGRVLGFTSLPGGFMLFLVLATGTHLLLVEVVKRRLMRMLLK
jgi:Mg2+-importing ATPase